jgi:hypothetical protein
MSKRQLMLWMHHAWIPMCCPPPPVGVALPYVACVCVCSAVVLFCARASTSELCQRVRPFCWRAGVLRCAGAVRSVVYMLQQCVAAGPVSA